MISQLRKLLFSLVFWIGYFIHKLFGFTPYYSYLSLRKLFVLTNGKFNDRLSDMISRNESKVDIEIEKNGVLGDLSGNEIDQIVSSLDRDGFYFLNREISQEYVEELVSYAEQAPCKLLDQKGEFKFDRKNIVATKYYIEEENLLQNEIVQKMLTDSVILSVAKKYLRSIPISDSITMWWSTAFKKQADAKAAQLFHFDMDRVKFLKFFVYLTDVTNDNGPHVYVKGSHKSLPKELRHDGRMPDNEVNRSYDKEKFVKITGKKGAAFFADTRGIHKGEPLQKGERLMFQLEFTNTLFGAPAPKVGWKGNGNIIANYKTKYPKLFRRYYPS